MRKMKKLALLALLPLSFSALAAEEREWIPYKKLLEVTKFDKFYALPAAERDKVAVYITFAPNNKAIKPADMALTVVHSGGRTALPVTADGRLSMVPVAKWIGEDAKIWTQMPKGEKAAIGFGMNAVLPEGQQWSYASAMGSVPQANAAIKQVAGALSLFAPSIKSVVFKFAKPAQLKIQAHDGVKQYSSDARNEIWLKPDDMLLKENPLMVASERPREVELETDTK